MKWFKHDADARNSLKLRKVRRKYGADGYAIYWFCLEAIAHEVDKDNLTFNLKEDAETIAFELNIQEKLVEEIMHYLVETGLFESSHGVITCLKLAERLDKSMTNSPKMRKWLDAKSVMTCADDVMTSDDGVSTCAELDKNRLEENRKEIKEPFVSSKPKRSKFNYSDDDYRFGMEMFARIQTINPSAKEPNLKAWANTIRLMREIDNRNHADMWQLFDWANKDSFWCSNILSPDKLRSQFDKLQVKINETNRPSKNAAGRRLSAVERQQARVEAKYGYTGS